MQDYVFTVPSLASFARSQRPLEREVVATTCKHYIPSVENVNTIMADVYSVRSEILAIVTKNKDFKEVEICTIM